MKKSKAAPLTSTLMARKGDSLTARSGEAGQAKGVSALQDEIVARLAEEITRESGVKFGTVQSASIQSATMRISGLNAPGTGAPASQAQAQAQAQAQTNSGAHSRAMARNSASPLARQAPGQLRPLSARSSGHKPASLADRQALLSSSATGGGVEEDAQEAPREGPSAILGSVFEVNFGRAGRRPVEADEAALGPVTTDDPSVDDEATARGVEPPPLQMIPAEARIAAPALDGEVVSDPRAAGDPSFDGTLADLGTIDLDGPDGDVPRESSVPFLLLFVLAVAVSGAIGLWLTRSDESRTQDAAGSALTAPPPGIDATRPAESVPDVVPSASAPVDVTPLAAAKPRPNLAEAKPTQDKSLAKPTEDKTPVKPAEDKASMAPVATAMAQPTKEEIAPPPGQGAGETSAVDTAPRTGYSVQLMSAKRKAIAESEWARLSTAYAALLADQPHAIVAGEVPDRGTYYRLRVGQFATGREARTFCSGLDEQNLACLVVKN